MIRVLLADDHVIVRKGLIELLSRQPDMKSFGEAGSGKEALEALEREPWDVLLLDLSLPDRNGLEVLAEVRRLHQDLPVLVLTMHPEDQLAVEALRAGASAYLTKETAPEELVNAIRQILKGRRYVSARLAERLADDVSRGKADASREDLSGREFQVLCRVASGASVKEIAAELAINAKTVSTYRLRLLKKLRVRTNAELTFFALANGLVTELDLRQRSRP